MADLVTLTQVKNHLRIDGTSEDTDLALKISQASEIVLDYIGARVGSPVVIESSSVASPTVITTEEAHGYSNGNTVTIEGHEDSTPEIFGSYVVSNVTELTFTIPVAVTVGGTGGTVALAWTETTVPAVVKAAVLLQVANLYGFRGDDVEQPAGQEHGYLAPGVVNLLKRYRDPVVA